MSEASRATVCGKYSRPVILMKGVRNTKGGQNSIIVPVLLSRRLSVPNRSLDGLPVAEVVLRAIRGRSIPRADVFKGER